MEWSAHTMGSMTKLFTALGYRLVFSGGVKRRATFFFVSECINGVGFRLTVLANSQPGTIGSSFIPISRSSCPAGSQFITGTPPAGLATRGGDTDTSELGVLSREHTELAVVFPAVATPPKGAGKIKGVGWLLYVV